MIQSLTVSVVGASLFLFGIVIDERSLVPVGSAAAVLCGVWYLSSRLQKLEDGQAELFRRIKRLPCQECDEVVKSKK